MIKRIVIYLIITICLAYALQWFVVEGLRKNKQGIYEKYTTVFLKKNSYNTIMVGSSRMFMHLDNQLFDSLCHTNSYNIGLPGATMRLSYACLKAYCQNSTMPQTVFLELDYHISHIKTGTIYNFSTYIPYLKNQELYTQLSAIDKRFIQFKYNPFYALPHLGINSLSASVNGWFGRTGFYDHYFYQGFFKNELIDDYNNVQAKNENSIINQETRSYLDSILQFCKSQNSQLYFAISPAYKDVSKEMKYHQPIIDQFKTIANRNRIILFDFSGDTTITNHKVYFEDNYHMLHSGALIYTQKIAADFNNIPR